MTPEQLAAEFPLGPDSLPQAGVPVGRIEKFAHTSRIFSGTARDCWIYVPVQYDPATPACVMVVQDGADHLKPERRWHIPTVLDNLIHRGEIPVTIGIFIDPGTIPAAVAGAAPRANRSFEYDSLGDRYARFLLEEILPEVGRRYNLRQDGNSRCVMGGSSGAFCAFNAAWERPEEFARVVSIVGSYTALRGGHTSAAWVRLAEPKPLRIFLQSGAADLKVFAGDWWTANLEMLSALEYAGYEVNHAWAEHAGHDEFHGSMIFPEAVRWVWQGYPDRISAGVGSKQPLMRVLTPGDGWKSIEGDYRSANALAADAKGRVYFVSPEEDAIYGITNRERPVKMSTSAKGMTGIACAANGRVYGCQPGAKRIVAFDEAGTVSILHEGIEAHGLCVARNRNIYATDPTRRRIWIITPGSERTAVATELVSPMGISLSADGGSLYVTDAGGTKAWIFSVRADGSLADGAPFFPLQARFGEPASGAGEIAVSERGWSFFATRVGLQLADAAGLIAGIVPVPGNQRADGVAIGGAARDELYVTCGGRVWSRPIRLAESLWC